MRLDKCKHSDFVSDLRNAYNSVVEAAGCNVRFMTKKTIIEKALLLPAKSFYCTYEEGARRIHRIEKYGESGTKGLNKLKYEALYEVYLQLSGSDLPVSEIIRIAVDSPAPRFYITNKTAYQILNKNL